MNKKLISVGVSVAVGTAMLITTAFASMTGTTGYEVYKSAIKNTVAAKSLAGDFKITVKDNGNTIVDGQSSVKFNRDNESMSQTASAKAGNQTVGMETYRQDGKTITKTSDSDVYNVRDASEKKHGTEKKDKEQVDPQVMQDGEKVVDALVGNLQNYVTLGSNTDGTSEVSVQLSNSQIPAVANAAASMLVRNASRKDNHENEKFTSFVNELRGNLPKLVSDIRIDSISLKAQINKDNLIQNQVVDITASGKDANGNAHQITISLNANFSGFNATTPDKIDLTGKQVKTVQAKEFKHQDEQED